jgi:hypothetical protein
MIIVFTSISPNLYRNYQTVGGQPRIRNGDKAAEDLVGSADSRRSDNTRLQITAVVPEGTDMGWSMMKKKCEDVTREKGNTIQRKENGVGVAVPNEKENIMNLVIEEAVVDAIGVVEIGTMTVIKFGERVVMMIIGVDKSMLSPFLSNTGS